MAERGSHAQLLAQHGSQYVQRGRRRSRVCASLSLCSDARKMLQCCNVKCCKCCNVIACAHVCLCACVPCRGGARSSAFCVNLLRVCEASFHAPSLPLLSAFLRVHTLTYCAQACTYLSIPSQALLCLFDHINCTMTCMGQTQRRPGGGCEESDGRQLWVRLWPC